MAGPTPSLQYSWDGPGALGAGSDGKALCWDNTAGRFVVTAKANLAHTHAPADLTQGGAAPGQALVWNGAAWAPGSAGVTDHGALSGLADDDHAQYALADKSRPATWVSAGDLAARSLADLGTRAHSALTGLSADDHTQYFKLATETLPATRNVLAVAVADAGKGLFDLNWSSPGHAGPSSIYLRRAGTATLGYQFTEWLTYTNNQMASYNLQMAVGGQGSPLMTFGWSSVSWTIYGQVVMGLNTVSNESVTIRPWSAAGVPLVVKGFASQSASLQEWKTSASAVVASVGPGGNLNITHILSGLTASGLRMSLANGGTFDIRDGGSQTLYQCSHGSGTHIFRQFNAAAVAVTVRGHTAQASNLMDWTDNTPTVLSSVDAAGRHLVPLGALATCGLAFLGDPNTGLYSAAADTVSIVAGGADRLKADGTGLGFFAVSPVAQQAGIADVSGGAVQDAEARAAINSLLAKLEAYGLLAAA